LLEDPLDADDPELDDWLELECDELEPDELERLDELDPELETDGAE
jgi:hypothetical protein